MPLNTDEETPAVTPGGTPAGTQNPVGTPGPGGIQGQGKGDAVGKGSLGTGPSTKLPEESSTGTGRRPTHLK